MATEAQFLSFFGAVHILGPKSPPPASALPGVRWNYAKLVKAAAAHWRVAQGERAVFDAEWFPRMWGFLVRRQEKMHPLVGREVARVVLGRSRAVPQGED